MCAVVISHQMVLCLPPHLMTQASQSGIHTLASSYSYFGQSFCRLFPVSGNGLKFLFKALMLCVICLMLCCCKLKCICVSVCLIRHLFPSPPPQFMGGANDAYVRSVSFSHDGRHIATVSDDRFRLLFQLFLSYLLQLRILIFKTYF